MYRNLLAWRYFIKRPISLLAVISVSLCVFIVVVVMTVMNGLVSEFREKNHRYVGDCVISSDSLVGFGYYQELLEILDADSMIAAASPVTHGMGLLSQPGRDLNMGVEIYGVDPVRHSQATAFGDSLHFRKDQPDKAFVPTYAPELVGCVLGIDFMGRRNQDGSFFHPAQPDMLRVVVSSFPLNIKGGLAKAGTDLVNSQTYWFSDDSHTGLVKVDGHAVYLPIKQAQLLCGMDLQLPRVTSIHIKFATGIPLKAGVNHVKRIWQTFVEDRAGKAGANLYENVKVESWQDNRRTTIAPMEKEQTMLILLFLLLGLITIFIVFVVLYMIISHKSKDIGILKSFGVSMAGVMGVFVQFAVWVGVAGSAIGLVSGCVFVININRIENWLNDHYQWKLWDRSIYAIGDIPNQLHWEVLTTILLAAIASCVLGAIVPGLQAGRKTPAEILQVNQL